VERKTGGGKSLEAGTWQAREAWVGFPKAEDGGSDKRVQVQRVAFPAPGARVRDLAVLYLAEPVPAGVAVAPLRCPRSGDLVGRRWWCSGSLEGTRSETPRTGGSELRWGTGG